MANQQWIAASVIIRFSKIAFLLNLTVVVGTLGLSALNFNNDATERMPTQTGKHKGFVTHYADTNDSSLKSSEKKK